MDVKGLADQPLHQGLQLFSCAPMLWEEHLEVALHVFLYLKSKGNSIFICDLNELNMGKSTLVECDWSDFYPCVEEAMLPNTLNSFGNGVMLQIFVDSDHVGDTWPNAQDLTFQPSSILVWLIGFQRTNQQWRPQCLVLSFAPLNTASRNFMVFATSSL